MADAVPDDPVARAKAIALKFAAQAAAPSLPTGDDSSAAHGSTMNVAVAMNSATPSPAPAAESELGKRKNRWGEDPQPAPSMPAGFGIPAALMQATPSVKLARKKLFVPVNEHPDFNFMGVLIGPRGSSLKAMEQRTGAKIVIRGKGSQKDQSVADPESNEELHVTVEGIESAVATATEEIEGIFKNPHKALLVKSEQLRSLADMNGSGGAGGDSSNSFGASAYGPAGGEDYEVEMAVPNKMVGLIIGRGGQNIQSMQRDYNITIQIASQNEVPPGSETRPVKLKGTRQSVESCRSKINQVISDRENELAGGYLPGTHYGPGPAPSRESNSGQHAHNHLTIPDDKVGLVIGKGGGTIKGVQSRTGAHIQIPGDPDANDRSKRTIVISAASKEAADRAMAEVQNILSADAASLGGSTAPPGSQVLYVVIPDEKVGLVIGKGGTTIKELQNRTGCRIQIPSQTDAGSHPPSRRVTLTGVGDAPHNAKRDIEMMVQDDDRNRYGGGVVPPPHQAYGSPPPGHYGGPPTPYGAPPPQGYYGAPPPQPQPYQPYGMPPHQPYQPVPQYQPYGQPLPQQPAYPQQPIQYQPLPQMAPAPAVPEQAPAPGQMQQPAQQQQQSAQQQPTQQQQSAQQQQQQQPTQQQQYYQQQQAPSPAATAPAPQPAAAASSSAPGPVDMTQYHDQFWQYAAYYGEQVARDQYGAWAPPVGTPPPPGVTIPPPGQANPPPQA